MSSTASAASSPRCGPTGAEVYRFPPVVSRKLIEKSGYLKSFPNLLGCVCALNGDEAHIEGAVERFLARRRKLDARCRADRPAAGARRLLSDLRDRRAARDAARGRLRL